MLTNLFGFIMSLFNLVIDTIYKIGRALLITFLVAFLAFIAVVIGLVALLT